MTSRGTEGSPAAGTGLVEGFSMTCKCHEARALARMDVHIKMRQLGKGWETSAELARQWLPRGAGPSWDEGVQKERYMASRKRKPESYIERDHWPF